MAHFGLNSLCCVTVRTTLHPFTPARWRAMLACRLRGGLKLVTLPLVLLVFDHNERYDKHQDDPQQRLTQATPQNQLRQRGVLELSAAVMSLTYTQLPLTRPIEELKKSCICEIDGKRCTRPRQHKRNEKKYIEYHHDVTDRWNDLVDERESNGLLWKFTEHQLCLECWESGRGREVMQEFLRRKGIGDVATPPRQQRAASAQATSSTSGPSTRSRRRKRDSPQAPATRKTLERDATPDIEVADRTKHSAADSPSPSAAAGASSNYDPRIAVPRPLIILTEPSSPTQNATPSHRSTSRDPTSSAPSSITRRLDAPSPAVRRRLSFSSRSGNDANSSQVAHAPTAAAEIPTPSSRSGKLASSHNRNRNQDSGSPATSTIRGPMRHEIALPPPPPPPVGADPRGWWQAFVLGVFACLLACLLACFLAFVIWAVCREESSFPVIGEVEVPEAANVSTRWRMVDVSQSYMHMVMDKVTLPGPGVRGIWERMVRVLPTRTPWEGWI